VIRFRKSIETAKIHNPLKEFKLESQQIEYRTDPLSGFTSTFHISSMKSSLFKTDWETAEKLTAETQVKCLFCPGKVGTDTPKFPSNLVPGGRQTRGEATIFPNIFAQKSHSAVIALTKKHFLRLSEFTPQIYSDAFKLAADFLHRSYEVDGTRYDEIGQNYLYPSGSSVAHPHIQAMSSHWSYYLIKLYLEKAREHYGKYSINYWEELIKKEKRLKQRYLGRLGNTEWFVPFAPGHHHEVNFTVRNKSNFLEFEEEDWENLADGISRVLKAYHDIGLSCFNFALYSAPPGRNLNYFWAGGRMVSRSSIQTFPTSDIWYGPNILLYGFIWTSPEEFAGTLRPYFC
jgi:UDPglucose--hexose-1-phosphate uridylyltransferase